MTILTDLLYNIALLVTLTYTYGLLKPHLAQFSWRWQNILTGVIFGVSAIIAMTRQNTIVPGIILDGRFSILAIAALFGGGFPGIIATAMMSAYRLALGGAGAPLGVAGAMTVFAISLLLRTYLARHNRPVTAPWLLVLGLLVGIQTMFWLSFSPIQVRVEVLREAAIPVLFVFPASVVILGLLIRHQDHQLRLADELRQSEQRYREEHNLLRALIDSSPDFIYVKDTHGRYIVNNVAHARSANSTPSAMIGKTASDVFDPPLPQQFLDDDRTVIVTGKSLLNIEQTQVNADGTPFITLANKIPLIDADDRVIGLIGISRDITERKKLERQTLELSAERLRITLLQKFISDVAHDFKTPLTIINTSIYLLGKTTDPEQQRTHLEKLEAQAARLAQMFDDFLTMHNLDTNAIPLVTESFDFNQLVSLAVEESRPLAQRKNHSLTYTSNVQLPPLTGDPFALRHAINDLLHNAINFTPDGGTVIVRTTRQDQFAVLEVRDSGIGISPDDLPHIFERLYRADIARSTRDGGTGLGLSIAKKVADAHGGSITVESSVDNGSTFRMLLPLNTSLDL